MISYHRNIPIADNDVPKYIKQICSMLMKIGKLPNNYVYHWTYKHLLENIKKEGLVPMIGGCTEEHMPNTFTEYLPDYYQSQYRSEVKDLKNYKDYLEWVEEFPEAYNTMLEDIKGVYLTTNPEDYSNPTDQNILLIINIQGLESHVDVTDTEHSMIIREIIPIQCIIEVKFDNNDNAIDLLPYCSDENIS